MSAGIEALRALEDSEIARIGGLGERLRAGLRELEYEVSGQGSLCKLHPSNMEDLWWRLYREGVLVGMDGLMCLSTPMDEGVVDRALEAFARDASRRGAGDGG
jgi:glutamate-1-semialdehyde 2,1-aminomutase